MSIAALRQGFEAFACGELSESELRAAVRAAVAREPHQASAYIALVRALGRDQVIGAELEIGILADIGTLAAARSALPGARAESGKQAALTTSRTSARIVQPPAATGLEVPIGAISPLDTRPIVFDEPIYADPIDPRANTLTGSTGRWTWEAPERFTAPAARLVIGSLLKRRFELLEELGRSGTGVVYKALDRTSAEFKERSRYVAIKVLNEEFKRQPLALRSLQREVRKAQKLAHPNIATVFDFDHDGGNVYMLMQLLTGRSLEQLLRGDAAYGLPLPRVHEIVGAMGAALRTAHEQGIVHAGLKPSSVFITDAGQVKVLDFGFAHAIGSLNVTGENSMFDAGQLGALSPAYASLEMLNGEVPEPRDDIYALACITYELLTGRHPFNRIDARKACAAGLRAAAPRQLSRRQWRALRQGLAFRPTERNASVQACVDAVFSARGRRRGWPMVAALILIAAAAGLWAPHLWPGRQAARLSQALLATDPAQFASALAELRAARPALRARALANEAARLRVIDHYAADIAAASAAPDYEFARARSELSELRNLLPESAVVTDMSAALEQAAQQAAQQAASIDLLKQKLAEQAVAGDVAGADATASALRRLPAGSVFVSTELPEQLISAYLHSGKNQALAGNVGNALKTLAAGREAFGSSPELKALEARYEILGDAYQRLSGAVVLDIDAQRRDLDALRASEGSDFPELEKMLARTLADRIADVRAGNQPAVAAKLLQQGESLFPSFAALLEQGKAGALPDAPLAVTGQ